MNKNTHFKICLLLSGALSLTIGALHADEREAKFRAEERRLTEDMDELKGLQRRIEELSKLTQDANLNASFRETQRDELKKRLREYQEKAKTFNQNREDLKAKYGDLIHPPSTPKALSASRVSGLTLVSDDETMAVFKTPGGQEFYVDYTPRGNVVSLRLAAVTWQTGTLRFGLQAFTHENEATPLPARVSISSADSTTGKILREEVSQALRGGVLTWTLNEKEAAAKDPVLIIQVKSAP